MVRRKKDFAGTRLDDELVLLDPDGERYVNLNPVAAEIWDIIADPVGFQQLIERLTETYDIDAGTCKTEVASFLKKLNELKLIDVQY